MRHLLIFTLLLIGLSSCSREYYVNKYCPISKVKDSIYVEVHDTLIAHDTVLITRSDTAIIHDSVPCDDFKKEFHHGRASIKIEVKDSILTAECVCDSVEQKLRYYEHIHKEIMKKFHSEERTAVIKKKSGAFYRWWFWITAILIALWIAFKILKWTGTFPITVKRSG